MWSTLEQVLAVGRLCDSVRNINMNEQSQLAELIHILYITRLRHYIIAFTGAGAGTNGEIPRLFDWYARTASAKH